MRAVVFEQFEQFPTLKEVAKPTPGAGEVLLKVAGAGCCHSDVAMFQDFTADSPITIKPPFTLGHENSGWVEEVGPGVTGIEKGDAYLVYGPTGCGHCRMCVQGLETYCENAATNRAQAVGIGRDGGMADYVVVPARNLVPLGDADPIAAAPLSDAALTPYHAVKQALPALAGGGKYALVVGLGGLGQMAVQILTALTGATIIATDVKPGAMAKAQEAGAVTVSGGEDQLANIRKITGGRGVDAAFDFVGVAPTVELVKNAAGIGARVVIVGIADGRVEWNFTGVAYEATINSTYWGSVSDLHDVVAMYRNGQLVPDNEYYTLDNALEAYRKLVDGKLSARAVVVPNAPLPQA